RLEIGPAQPALGDRRHAPATLADLLAHRAGLPAEPLERRRAAAVAGHAEAVVELLSAGDVGRLDRPLVLRGHLTGLARLAGGAAAGAHERGADHEDESAPEHPYPPWCGSPSRHLPPSLRMASRRPPPGKLAARRPDSVRSGPRATSPASCGKP